MDYPKLAPEAYAALSNFSDKLNQGTLEKTLIDLVYQRVSQINGCAYCLALHGRHLRKAGEREERLDTLAAWKESPHFRAHERAALQWAEEVTQLKDRSVPKEGIAKLRQYFSDRQIAELTFAIAGMNAWNRMAIALHRTTEQPAAAEETV